MVCISHAPIEKLRAYKQRMGWSIPFVSSFRNDFNFDFGVSFDKERGSAEYNFQKVDFMSSAMLGKDAMLFRLPDAL